MKALCCYMFLASPPRYAAELRDFLADSQERVFSCHVFSKPAKPTGTKLQLELRKCADSMSFPPVRLQPLCLITAETDHRCMMILLVTIQRAQLHRVFLSATVCSYQVVPHKAVAEVSK